MTRHLRASLVSLAAVALVAALLVPVTSAAPAKRVRGKATVQLTVTVERIGAMRASGPATFTGVTAKGVAFSGKGTAVLNGVRLAGGGFDPDGTGSITFTAEATAKGKRVRITDGRGMLGFAQDAGMETGIFRAEATLSFIGTPVDGQGI